MTQNSALVTEPTFKIDIYEKLAHATVEEICICLVIGEFYEEIFFNVSCTSYGFSCERGNYRRLQI